MSIPTPKTTIDRAIILMGLITISIAAIAVVIVAEFIVDHRPAVVQPKPTPVVGPPQPPIPVTPPAPTPLPPAPTLPPLVVTTKEYRSSLGGWFGEMAGRARGGDFKTKSDVANAFRSHATPLANELGKAIDSHSDAGGTITDANGLADVFASVEKALGGAN